MTTNAAAATDIQVVELRPASPAPRRRAILEVRVTRDGEAIAGIFVATRGWAESRASELRAAFAEREVSS